MINKIYFAKIKSNAIIPSKREEDMAYDVYACFDEKKILIASHSTKLIPTGIASAFNKKWGISLRERGSNGSIGMKVSAGQIDSGYRGEWFVAITNTNDIPIFICKEVNKITRCEGSILYPYTKAICQAKIEEVPQMIIDEIPYDELKTIESERGIGKLGSSEK
ncbi:MAG TPA: hypothetical protein VK982_14695 [Bacteroidales bacterium]|nr:hypothetical protein [Bacteroidales bacterium]